MYICICNGISDAALDECLRKDCSYQAVCKTLGMADSCGQCESVIKQKLTQFKLSSDQIGSQSLVEIQ